MNPSRVRATIALKTPAPAAVDSPRRGGHDSVFREVWPMAVRMELSRILIRELVDYQIIELREAAEEGEEENGEQKRSFPIVIGLPEAQAIERRIKGIAIKRPQTHDLLATVITQLGGVLKSITI